jgi:SAM-dependent methyltransferase
MLTVVTGTAAHVLRNRVAWDRWAERYADAGLRQWAAAEPTWGIWGIAERQAGVLPPDRDGLDSIELGCGTGYVSAWLARRGARPAGLDNSSAQLTTARELQERFGLLFPLFQANAEQAPFADASFDLAITEYGASIWCDPYAWIPKAARLLRPGRQLIFLANSVLMMLTIPDQDGLPARLYSPSEAEQIRAGLEEAGGFLPFVFGADPVADRGQQMRTAMRRYTGTPARHHRDDEQVPGPNPRV